MKKIKNCTFSTASAVSLKTEVKINDTMYGVINKKSKATSDPAFLKHTSDSYQYLNEKR